MKRAVRLNKPTDRGEDRVPMTARDSYYSVIELSGLLRGGGVDPRTIPMVWIGRHVNSKVV
jgi:hypothetical protein